MQLTVGPRADRRSTSVSAVAAGLVVIAAAVAGCGSSPGSATQPTAPSGSQSTPPLGYRSLPSFLPTAATPVDRVVTASAAHAQLAVQGVAVRVALPAGRVLAAVTGPKVPPFVSPPPPEVTATFTISLARAHGSVPIRLSDFTITDQLGRTFHPGLVTGEAAPPSRVAPGRRVTFRLTAVLPTGEGRLHWAPTGGAPIVSWDFIVEND